MHQKKYYLKDLTLKNIMINEGLFLKITSIGKT